MADRIVPFVRGMKVGLGYDRLLGEPITSPAIAGPSITAAAGAKGQVVTTELLTVNDVESLHKTVGVTADAGGSYMGFSASAKVDFLNSFSYTGFSTFVVVRVSVRNAIQTIDSPAFLPDATELIINNNKERFRERFGDCFISGIQTGGEYFAVYQISGTMQSETESTSTDVRAAFGNATLGVNLHTKIETALTRSSSHLEVNVRVFRAGVTKTADLSLEDIMKTARDFPESVAGDQAIAFEALLESYNRLKSPNDALIFLEIQQQQDVLADLAKKRFEFLTLRDTYVYILKHSESFRKSDGSPVVHQELTDAHAAVVSAINTMQKEAERCSRNAKACSFTPFEAATFKVPVLAENPLASLANQGLIIARRDALALAIRTTLTGLTQRGFDLGMAIAEEHTAPGAGKQDFVDRLQTADERRGCQLGVLLSVDRNRNSAHAQAGQAVALANPIIQKARSAEPVGLFTLGFDIASGIFGDPAQGAQGNTGPGTGSDKALAELNSKDAQRGFIISRALNIGPPPLRS